MGHAIQARESQLHTGERTCTHRVKMERTRGEEREETTGRKKQEKKWKRKRGEYTENCQSVPSSYVGVSLSPVNVASQR